MAARPDMLPDVRLVAIDMDGTLLGSNGAVSLRNLKAMQAATEAGIHIVIATGRRHSYAMKVLRALNLDPDSVIISSNGTVTRTVNSQLVRRTLLPMESAVWLCDHLKDFRNALVFTFDRVGADGEDCRGALVVEELDDLHTSIGSWMIANDPYIERASPMKSVFDGTDERSPIQAMLCGTLLRMRAAEQLLLAHEHVFSHGHSPAERIHTARVSIHRTEYPLRDLCIVDLLPAGCSKGMAMLDLCRDRGIAPSETLAIGDNWNDLPLFEAAGRSVVMGNAAPDLQSVAAERGWDVGFSNDEDGVARVLEQIV